MEDKTVELRKIPLEEFILVLKDIFDKGADYIDIIGKADEEQDVISIVVKSEYMSEEVPNGFENELEIYPKDTSSPSKIDINNLEDMI